MNIRRKLEIIRMNDDRRKRRLDLMKALLLNSRINSNFIYEKFLK